MRKPNRRRSPWEELSHLAHSEKFIDRAKTVLIAALVVSAAVLLARLGMFELGGPKQSGTDAAAGQDTQQHGGNADIAVAGPYVIVVTDAAGSHCGLMYDGTELKQAYDRLSAYLGEAFGSAGEPKSVSEEDFHAALKEQGVYFDFAYAQPLTVLASAIGTTMDENAKPQWGRDLPGSLQDQWPKTENGDFEEPAFLRHCMGKIQQQPRAGGTEHPHACRPDDEGRAGVVAEAQQVFRFLPGDVAFLPGLGHRRRPQRVAAGDAQQKGRRPGAGHAEQRAHDHDLRPPQRGQIHPDQRAGGGEGRHRVQ